MTAIVDDTFRVFAAARQGDLARVQALLAAMDEDDLTAFAAVLGTLRAPVLAELFVRAAQIVAEVARDESTS